MSPASRNRLLALVALLAVGGGLGFVALGNIGDNLVYYWSPSDLLGSGEKAYGPTIRLGGVVRPGSLKWDAARSLLRFEVADNHSATAAFVPVVATELPPQMFREGIGVVVEGTYDKSLVFSSARLMVNHSNEYRAPHGDMPEGEKPWQSTVSGASAQAGAR
jgi:cytochrome c-type biogenesis protein CcmE